MTPWQKQLWDHDKSSCDPTTKAVGAVVTLQQLFFCCNVTTLLIPTLRRVRKGEAIKMTFGLIVENLIQNLN